MVTCGDEYSNSVCWVHRNMNILNGFSGLVEIISRKRLVDIEAHIV